MADIDVEQKKAGQQTWIWATLAIISVLALMLWLASQEEETGPVVMEDDTTAVVADGTEDAGAETVELTAIAAAPADFADRTVRVNGVEVVATLGARAFWANIPGQNPFLVIVEEGAGDASLVAAQQNVNIRGTVGEVTEALVDEWIAAGAVNQGARDEATFATHAIMADQIRPAS